MLAGIVVDRLEILVSLKPERSSLQTDPGYRPIGQRITGRPGRRCRQLLYPLLEVML